MEVTKIMANIFALHLGASVKNIETGEIWKLTGIKKELGIWLISVEDLNGEYVNDWICDNCQLILTPLDKITDEDAIEVAGFYGFNMSSNFATTENLIEFGKARLLDAPNLPLSLTDYLRSKSYALPYLGICLYTAGIAIKP